LPPGFTENLFGKFSRDENDSTSPYVTVCPLPGFHNQGFFYSKPEFYNNTFNQDEVFGIKKDDASQYQVSRSFHRFFFMNKKSGITKCFYN
jgi:hypothetical protein